MGKPIMEAIMIALLGGLAGMIGFGVSDFFGKKLVDRIGCIRTFVYCHLIGTFMLALYLLNDSSMPVFSARNILYVALFGISSAIGFYSFYKALEVGKVSVVSPIASCFVIMSALVSFFLFGESISGFKLVSLIVVICGIILTSIDIRELRKGIKKEELAKGVPYAIAVMVIDGFWFPLWDRFITGSGWMIWTIIERSIAIMFIISIALIFAKMNLRIADDKRSIFRLMIIMAGFEALAALGNSWAFNMTEGVTSVIVAATATYPMITAMLAYFFLKERLSPSQYLGIGLILAGIVLMPFI